MNEHRTKPLITVAGINKRVGDYQLVSALQIGRFARLRFVDEYDIAVLSGLMNDFGGHGMSIGLVCL